MSMTVDQSKFQEQLRKYIAQTEKTIPQVLNQKMFYIVKRAMAETPVASRAAIQSTFNVSSTETVIKSGKRAGKIRRKYSYDGMNSSAFALMQYRRRLAGKEPIKKPTYADAEKFVSKAFGAVGTLRNGWVGAVGKLASVVNEGKPVMEFSARAKQRSIAYPATPGLSPEVTAIYRVVERIFQGHKVEQIDPRVVAALQNAFDAETKGMKEYLEYKLKANAP